jgi:hypothetical protein
MIVVHTGILPEQPTPDDALVLYEPEDYPSVRCRIRAAIDTQEDLDVYVKHPVCYSWFWDLQGYSFICVVNDGPVEQLKRKLAISAIPIDLSENPERILQLGLLELPDPLEKVDSVWTWILEQKIGKVWVVNEPSFQHLGSLAQWYAENTIPCELLQKARDIQSAWLRRAKGKVKAAYQEFLRDPGKHAPFLCCWQNLDTYEERVRESWLSEEGWYEPSLIWIAEKLPPLCFPSAARNRLSHKAYAHWNTYFQRSMDERQ